MKWQVPHLLPQRMIHIYLYLQTWAKQNFYAMKQRNNIHSLKKNKTITKPKDNFNFTTEIASMDQRRNLLKKKRYRYKML